LLLDNEPVSITGCKGRISSEPVYQQTLFFLAWIKGNLCTREAAALSLPSPQCRLCTRTLQCTQAGSASLENSSLPSNGKIDNDREKREEEMGQRISANMIKSLWGKENLSQPVQLQGSSR